MLEFEDGDDPLSFLKGDPKRSQADPVPVTLNFDDDGDDPLEFATLLQCQPHDDTPAAQSVTLPEVTAGRLGLLIQEAVLDDRFNGRRFYQRVLGALLQYGDLRTFYQRLLAKVGSATADHILMGVLRTSFFIEVVLLPKVETTKFEVRWGSRLASDDPRFASFDSCLEICLHLLSEVSASVDDADRRELLSLFRAYALVPYELPIDYVDPTLPAVHTKGNVKWVWGSAASRAIQLRSELMAQDLFQRVYTKVQVKAYLTDRATTGEFKSNREKRWESHPRGVQFASRLACLEVEYTLIAQLCSFEGFPGPLKRQLVARGLIDSDDSIRRCPITFEVMDFAKFMSEINRPTQGESEFHVGHLDPLKSGVAGHSANNVAWVTSDGNRIQGHLTVAETRALLRRIQDNEVHAQAQAATV